MNLSDIVAPADWRVLVETDDDGNSEMAEDFAKLLRPTEQARWLSLLELASQMGPKNMPSSNRHHIDKPNGVYEFIKGNYRISYFYDEDKRVICCHLFRKKTQTTPESEKEKARRLKQRYFEAKEAGTLKILDYEE